MAQHTPHIGTHLLPMVGLTCCLATTGLFDTVLSTVVTSPAFAVCITTETLTGGVTIIAACIFLALFARTRWFDARRFRLGAAIAFVVLQVIATALLVVHGAGALPDVAGSSGGLLLGATSTVLLALWARACAQEGATRSLYNLAGSLGLLTACNLVTSLLPDTVAIAVAGVAAAASPALLCAFENTQADAPCHAALVQAHTPDSMPWWVVLLVCTVGYGIVMGCVQSLGSSFDTSGFGAFLVTYSINIGALITAGAAVATARASQSRALLRVGILITLMAALYFSGIFGLASGPAGMLFMTVARMTTFLLIWAIACGAPLWRNEHGCWSIFAFSCGWGAFSLANTVSTKLGFAAALLPGTHLAYNVVVILVLVALFALEVLPQKLGLTQQTSNDTGDASVAPSPDQALQERCRIFGERHALTPREIEVLLPLVRGRGAATIATVLGVSPETARTHIRHIYAKTGIHNREDLMDAIEEEQA